MAGLRDFQTSLGKLNELLSAGVIDDREYDRRKVPPSLVLCLSQCTILCASIDIHALASTPNTSPQFTRCQKATERTLKAAGSRRRPQASLVDNYVGIPCRDGVGGSARPPPSGGGGGSGGVGTPGDFF